MSSEPPTGAPPDIPPPAEAPPDIPPPAAAGMRRATHRRFGRQLLAAALNWPGGRWPVPTVMGLLLISLLVVMGVELLPRALSDVTLTVRARTEVVTVDLEPGRTYDWWLPPGSYSLLTAPTAAPCEHRGRFDVICEFAEATALTIKNGANVRFALAPHADTGLPRFTIELKPSAQPGSPESLFDVRGHGDDLHIATNELLTFESQPVAQWRIPLLVERVQIGESLSESVAAADALAALARQPIMMAGDVRMFARALAFEERYQVKEERFDPADVVQIPADPADRERLLGVLSLESGEQRGFDLTLHTDLAEVFVRRLGAEHRIGVSMWAIVSQLPTWLALWVVFVSLIVVANYYAARLGELRGQKNEAQKK
jgi:hypothetical protein